MTRILAGLVNDTREFPPRDFPTHYPVGTFLFARSTRLTGALPLGVFPTQVRIQGSIVELGSENNPAPGTQLPGSWVAATSQHTQGNHVLIRRTS